MAKPYSLDEALQPVAPQVKGYSLEDALQPIPSAATPGLPTVNNKSVAQQAGLPMMAPPAEVPAYKQVFNQLDPKSKEYNAATFASDLGKNVAGAAVTGVAGMPLVAEDQVRSMARNELAGDFERPKGAVAGAAYDTLRSANGPQTTLLNKAMDAFKLGANITGTGVGDDIASKVNNIFKSKEQQAREKEAKQQADIVMAKVPHIEGLQQIYEVGKKTGTEIRESQSDYAKNAIANSQVTGDLAKSIRDRNLKTFSFGKDPSALGYVLQGSSVFGSMLPLLATAVITKNAGVGVGMGYMQSGAEAIDTARTYIGEQSDEFLAQNSPYFKKMIENGVDPKVARQVVTDKAEELAAQMQGAVGAFGGNITAKLVTGGFDKVIGKAAKNRLAKIAVGVVGESAEQGTEEFLEGIATDIGINSQVVKDIGSDAFANFVLGALGGAPVGAYAGARAKTDEQIATDAAEQARTDALEKARKMFNPTPRTTPGAAATTTPQATTSAVVTPEELESPENLGAPEAVVPPQEVPPQEVPPQALPAATQPQEVPVSVDEKKDTVTPVTVTQDNEQKQGPIPWMPGFERFEEVQPDGTIKSGVRKIEETSAPVETTTQEKPSKEIKTDHQILYDGKPATLTIVRMNDDPSKIADVKVNIDGEKKPILNLGKQGTQTDEKFLNSFYESNGFVEQIEEKPAQEITPEVKTEEQPATPQEEKYTDIGGKNKMRVREHFDEGIPQFTAYAQNEDGEFIHGDTFGSYELAVAWAERNKDKPEIDWSWGDIQNKVAKAKANRERQAAKQLNKIDASSIPLSTYFMGVQLGLTRQKEEDLERMTDKKAKPALIILEANNLIVKQPDGSYDLAPKGRQLLDELQKSYVLKNSPSQEDQEAFFAKYISQLANKKEKPAAPVEAAPVEKELTEAEKTAAANRQRQKVAQARALGKANRTDALSAYLARLGGISSKDKLDVARDRSVKGYNHIFKSGAPSLMARVEDGQLDDYLPYELRRQTHESNSEQPYDATEAYDYISEIIASGEPKRPHDKEEAAAQQELTKEQEAKQAREEEAAKAEEEAIKKANEELDMVSKEEREAEAESRIYEEPKEEIELKGETKEEIAAKEKAARAEANRKRQKEQQEKAAEAAGEFTLTGSNREADVAAAKGAQDLFAAKPNEIIEGRRVFLPKITLKGKVAQTGIVSRVLNNGKIEVRLQEGGYETLDKSELSLTKEGLGLEPIKSTAPKAEEPKVETNEKEQLKKDVQAIEDMDTDTRENTVHYDLPGGSPAHNIYEAQKMLPKPSDKLKKVTYENSLSLYQEYDYIANIDGELYGITKQEDPDEPDDESMFVYYYNKLFEPHGNHVSAWTDNKDDLFEYIRKQDNPAPVKQIEEIKSFKDATQDLENHRTKDAHTETEVAIDNFAREAVADFMVGDVVRYGNMEGRVVGVEGDYVKFRPDTATNPKAYQKVQKKQLKFQSRPAVGINFSASSKGEDNKFGEEQGKLVMDQERMLQLFGQNMYGAGLAEVAIKELLQNSFDAVKGAVRSKVIKEGDIKITINRESRTIKIQDNGVGMTPKIIRDAFFTIAGTDKSDLPPQERSGGFGIAKMGFLTGIAEIRLETIRDGVKSSVSATSGDITKSNFKIIKSPAPKNMHGTTIEVVIPETFVNTKNGEVKDISFPFGTNYITPLNQPLIGPTKLTLDFTSYGNSEEKVFPVGVNFDNKETPLLTKANFSWGTAEIYFGVKRAEHPKHSVLSSGVYQFRTDMMLSQSEKIPYDIIVNIKSDVPAGDIDYPFENSRERFKERIKDDITSLQGFLAKVARGEEAKEMQENFGGIVSMPRVEAGADIADVSKKLIKAFDKRGTEEKKAYIPTLPKVIEIKDNVVSDGKGNVIVDMKNEEKRKESTFVAEMDAPTRDQFMLTMKQDPKLPIFHNNTNVDYVAIGTPYGDPQAFFAELGTLMVEMKEELAKSGMWSYDQLAPENLFFAGVSVDKGYGGVHIKVPYKAVLLNPFYDWGSKSLFGVRATFLNTMIHELAHQGDMDHGVGHNSQMIKVENYLADAGMLDYFRDALMDVLARHESTFTAMKEAYGSSTTKNTAKSLATDKQGAASARGTRDGSESASGSILAGERRTRRLSFQNIAEQDTEGEERGRVAGARKVAKQRTNKQLSEQSAEDREEVIQELRVASAAGNRMFKKVANEGSNLRMQKEMNELLANKEALKDYLNLTRPANNSAIDFMNRATSAATDGSMNTSVEQVIRDIYEKYPHVLEGLKLSVRSRKVDGRDAGNFKPFSRVVTLWKDGSGVDNPRTIRHELMHSLEQMMTPQAKQNLIEAWYKALSKAIKDNVDEPSRKYFEAINNFLADPSNETMQAAINLLPDSSYELYQYLNPSEYWAVNAEKLMEQKLGTPWHRFTLAVRRLFEGLKNVLGFDNQYAVHKAFNDLIEGKPARKDDQREMIVDYLTQGKFTADFLANIQDDRDLINDLGVNEVPNNDKRTAKEMLVGSWKKIMEIGKEIYNDPLNSFTRTLVSAADAGTIARIEAIDFAAGLRDRDFAQTKGKIRYANGQFVAALSVKNSLHSAHIATQVILNGGLEYSTKYGQFLATKKQYSIKNIIQLQYEMRNKIGKKLADQVINTYLIAKRTRSIQNEYLLRSFVLEEAKDDLANATALDRGALLTAVEDAQDAYDDIVKAYNKIPKEFLEKDINGEIALTRITDAAGNVIEELPIIDDDAVDRAIARENAHPELAAIMKNWTAVNHNMLDNLAFSGRISQKMADGLKEIKDYVPWNRVMDENESIRGSFKRKRSTGVNKFGKDRTERDVDNVIERMQEFVASRTISTIRSYAENRIAMQYGTRNDKGKLKLFPSEGRSNNGTRMRIFANGRAVIIEIKDNLVADALVGLSATPIEYDFQNILSGSANFFRRAITFTGYFQVKQVFYDAPTAAWISGVRNPFKLFAGCFVGFARGLNPISTDPIIEVMRSAGFGGYFGTHRSAAKETKIQLGAFTDKGYETLLKTIDAIGDASDTSQRIPTYDQVLAETGDHALALFMASDVMDFSKHGKSKTALFLKSTVTFMQAYATQLDALAQASIGGNIKGKTRAEAAAMFYATFIPLATTCVLLAMAAMGDDDYWKLDDETRLRNFYVPYSTRTFGYPVLIPMHSTASLFFKIMPELLLNQITDYGTKDKMDKRRLHKVLANLAQDTLLGPTPIPTGIKPTAEIVLDHDFFTGSSVTPQNLKKLIAARQYTANTSELGKELSSWTEIPGMKNKRVLNPIEMDHIIRGNFGTIGSFGQWLSNELFKDNRVAPQAKENPLLGGFVGADVPRKQEDLFYDMKEATDTAYATYMNMVTRGRNYEAAQFFKENEKLIEGYGYTSGVDTALKTINAEMRRLGDRPNELKEIDNEINRVKEDQTISMAERSQALGQLYLDRGVVAANVANLSKRSPEQKRKELNEFAKNKNEILQEVESYRRDMFGTYEK
jgi:hypothetical protein